MSKSKGLTFYKKKKKISRDIVKEIFSWIFGILAAILLAFAFNYLFGMTSYVVGSSMEDELHNGQQILIDRFVYLLSSPKAGDVVVFLPNGDENSHYYVKRIVAVSGDTVRIASGSLYVNGKASKIITDKISDPGIAANEITLKNGEYFCIGDDPENSEDSRSAGIGPIKAEDIIGKAWFKFRVKEDSNFGLIR